MTFGSHRDVAFYTLSTLAKTVATFAAGLITARYIDPSDLGLWTSISLVLTYAVFLQGGIVNGVSRELPYFLGAKEDEKANICAGTAQTFIGGISLLILLTGFLATVLMRHETTQILWSMITVTGITCILYYQNYLTVTFRSKNSFRALAKTQFLLSLLMIVSIPMIYVWRYEGMLLRIFLIDFIGLIVLHIVRPLKVRLMWDWSMFKGLMKVGIPIFILSYVGMTAATVDKVILLWLGGVEQVGYYTLALITWRAMTIIPTSLTMYIYPRMTYIYGQYHDVKRVWNMALKATYAISAIMLPLVIMGYFSLPFLVPVLFPKYCPGIEAAQIFLFCAFFHGATSSVNALWSLKIWKYMIIFQLSRAALMIGGPLAGGYLLTPVLLGVASGMLGAYIICFVLGMVLTYKATH